RNGHGNSKNDTAQPTEAPLGICGSKDTHSKPEERTDSQRKTTESIEGVSPGIWLHSTDPGRHKGSHYCWPPPPRGRAGTRTDFRPHYPSRRSNGSRPPRVGHSRQQDRAERGLECRSLLICAVL